MLNRLRNKKSFKEENLRSWEKNTDFWLKHPHIDINVQNFLIQAIQSLCSTNTEKKSIVDLGCGDGWLLQYLSKRNVLFSKYIGIDYNHKFIEYLNNNSLSSNSEFKCFDIEKDPLPNLINQFDIVVNCLNLIEIPNLSKVFHNIVKITRKGGSILIISLNPFIEIIRDSNSLENIKNKLSIYEIAKSKTIIYRKIHINGEVSSNYYYRILYSSVDYFNMLKKYNLTLKSALSFSGNRDYGINPIFEFFHFLKIDS